MYLIRKDEEPEKFDTIMERIEDYELEYQELRYVIQSDSDKLVVELLEEKGDIVDPWVMTEQYGRREEERRSVQSDDYDKDEEVFEYYATDRISTAIRYYDAIHSGNNLLEIVIIIAN